MSPAVAAMPTAGNHCFNDIVWILSCIEPMAKHAGKTVSDKCSRRSHGEQCQHQQGHIHLHSRHQ